MVFIYVFFGLGFILGVICFLAFILSLLTGFTENRLVSFFEVLVGKYLYLPIAISYYIMLVLLIVWFVTNKLLEADCKPM